MDHYVITIARGYGSGGRTDRENAVRKAGYSFLMTGNYCEWHLMTAGYMSDFSGRRMNG